VLFGNPETTTGGTRSNLYAFGAPGHSRTGAVKQGTRWSHRTKVKV